jgi:hypothetical protein
VVVNDPLLVIGEGRRPNRSEQSVVVIAEFDPVDLQKAFLVLG